jgi:Gram-negative bacterial TonB protein C-terminal
MTLRYLGILLAIGISAKGADDPFRNGFFYHDDLHEVSMHDLDGLPIAQPLTPIEFPASLKSTGYIGDLWVTAAVRPDGTVRWAAVFRGNNRAFEVPVNKAVRGWRFTPPQKGGKAVAAFLDFHVLVSETSPVQITLEDPSSNHSADPSLSPGASPAVQESRPR